MLLFREKPPADWLPKVLANLPAVLVDHAHLERKAATSALNLADDPGRAYREALARHPLGRLGEPRDIAAGILYLASDESAFTTGTAQVIDGGWSN